MNFRSIRRRWSCLECVGLRKCRSGAAKARILSDQQHTTRIANAPHDGIDIIFTCIHWTRKTTYFPAIEHRVKQLSDTPKTWRHAPNCHLSQCRVHSSGKQRWVTSSPARQQQQRATETTCSLWRRWKSVWLTLDTSTTKGGTAHHTKWSHDRHDHRVQTELRRVAMMQQKGHHVAKDNRWSYYGIIPCKSEPWLI